MAGCPDIFGPDPRGAVAERASIGVTRIAVPGMQFAADPERQLETFAERIIRHFA